MPDNGNEMGGYWPRETRKTAGRRMLTAFRDALLPARCLGCGTWMTASESPGPLSKRIGSDPAGGTGNPKTERHGRAGGAALFAAGLSRLNSMICADCRRHVVHVRPPFCTLCGRIFRGRQGPDHPCGDCLRRPRHFASARSALLYTAGFRELVHRYKYRGKIQLAAPLGDILLAACLHFFNSDDIDLILPVPLHPKRFRQRGFNQACRLLASWKHLNKRLAPTPRLLVRTRATPPQAGLGKTERRRNICGAFAVRVPRAVQKRRVLLVDDVYTTGATADECARVLMQCGAERVNVLTLARAV